MCMDMDMSPCSVWHGMCDAAGAASLPPLCQKGGDQPGPPAPTPPPTPEPPAPQPPAANECIADSSQPQCKDYNYPDPQASADIARVCGAMPDMSGCSVWNNCTVRLGVGACKREHVHPLSGSACESMLSVCKEAPPIPRTAMPAACADHALLICMRMPLCAGGRHQRPLLRALHTAG